MLTSPVTQCTDEAHKIECAKDVYAMLCRRVATHVFTDSLITLVRQYIPQPCICHTEALTWIALRGWGTGEPVVDRLRSAAREHYNHIRFGSI